VKINALLTFILLIAISCKDSPEKKHAKDGVTFIFPKGWKISEDNKLENGAHLLTVEKDGFSSSGLLNITWVNGEVETGAWLDSYKKKLSGNVIYKKAKLKFGSMRRGRFGSFETEAVGFELKLLGIKHKGALQAFVAKNKSSAILKQQAFQDTAENRAGFKTIEASFAVD
jgi:hypothetical protein